MEGGRSSDPAEWDPMYGEVKGMHVWRDMLCLPCMPKPLMDDVVDNFHFQEGDVILLSYPQSSFIWIQEMIWHLHNLDTLDTPRDQKVPLAFRVPFLEHCFKGKDIFSLMAEYKGTRIIKSHWPYKLLQKQLQGVEDKVKVILWTLNPKDTMTNYHDNWLTQGSAHFNFPRVEWNHFFQLYQEQKLFEGDWFDMNLSWVNKMGGRSNFLQLSYEGTAEKPLAATVRHLAEFCGVTVSDEEVEKVLRLKEYDVPFGWKRLFNDQQRECIEERCREELKDSRLERYGL